MALVCASFDLGHKVHGLHAIFSRRERGVPVVVTSAGGAELSLTDGGTVHRYRNHDLDRLRTLIDETDAELRLVQHWHLLVLQIDGRRELFSLTNVDDEWEDCEMLPPEVVTYPVYPPWGRLYGEGQGVKWWASG